MLKKSKIYQLNIQKSVEFPNKFVLVKPKKLFDNIIYILNKIKKIFDRINQTLLYENIVLSQLNKFNQNFFKSYF